MNAFASIIEAAGTLAGVQDILNAIASAEQRKEAIMWFFAWHDIDADQCELLIQAYQLETA